MAKKEVILEAQERFDIEDARALQTLTYSYVSEALGSLVGRGAGLLTPLTYAYSDAPDENVVFNTTFSFYQTTSYNVTNGPRGEVVQFNPANTAQSVTSISYTAEKVAARAYYAANPDVPITQNRDGDFGSGAFPILWAREKSIAGTQDARRKWSVALQTEVPVTMNTREISCVEFSWADNMTGPVDDGQGIWAPIAKVIGWKASGGLATEPVLRQISVWDNADWLRRSQSGGTDRDGDNTLDNFWSIREANINTINITDTRETFEQPWGSRWHYMFSNRDVQGGEVLPNLNQADLKTWLLDAVQVEDSAYNPSAVQQSDSPFSGNFSGTAGIIDLFAGIRTILKQLAGKGIRDYPTGADADASPLAALTYSGRAVRNLATQTRAQADAAALVANAKLYAHGDADGNWAAPPLRSVNALSIEQVVQNETIKALERDLEIQEEEFAKLKARVQDLEDNAPFQDLPFNDARVISPVATVNFRPNYHHRTGYLRSLHGGAVRSVSFCILNSVYRFNSHAAGYVEIEMDEAELAARGVPPASFQDCAIFATPVHHMGDGGWLSPYGKFYTGGVFDPKDAENSRRFIAERQAKSDHDGAQRDTRRGSGQVLENFANFFQCTLNVVTVGVGHTRTIRVYPVSTVPDAFDQAKHLRGYPHLNHMTSWFTDFDQDGSDFVRRLGYDQSQNFNAGAYHDSTAAAGETGEVLFGDITNPLMQWRSGAIGGSAPTGADTAFAAAPSGQGLNTHASEFVGDGGAHHSTGVIWGNKLIGDKIINDDLRGPAPRITYLRPDRYHYGYPEGSNQYSEDTPQYFNNSAGPTHADYHDDIEASQRGDANTGFTSTETIRVGDKARVSNGRFMPAFNLVLYPPAFCRQDMNVDNSDYVYISPGINFVNHNSIGGVQVPDVPHKFRVAYHQGQGAHHNGDAPQDATAAGSGNVDISVVHTGNLADLKSGDH